MLPLCASVLPDFKKCRKVHVRNAIRVFFGGNQSAVHAGSADRQGRAAMLSVRWQSSDGYALHSQKGSPSQEGIPVLAVVEAPDRIGDDFPVLEVFPDLPVRMDPAVALPGEVGRHAALRGVDQPVRHLTERVADERGQHRAGAVDDSHCAQPVSPGGNGVGG